MFDVKEKPKLVERALLVRVYQHASDAEASDAMLDELSELVATLDIPVVDRVSVRCPTLHAGLLTGTGKAEELKEHAIALKIDCIVFDNELSPAQQRNWEGLTDITTLDRQEIIEQVRKCLPFSDHWDESRELL